MSLEAPYKGVCLLPGLGLVQPLGTHPLPTPPKKPRDRKEGSGLCPAISWTEFAAGWGGRAQTPTYLGTLLGCDQAWGQSAAPRVSPRIQPYCPPALPAAIS